MAKKPPEFEVVKSPDFKILYTNGMFGNVTPLEGRIIFYVQHPEPKIKEDGYPGQMETAKVVQELLVEIHMSPFQFKLLHDWMGSSIKNLEKAGYKFPKPSEKDKSHYVA